MENPFEYTDDNKRYHTLHYHLAHRFSHRVFKAVIDAQLTCPNLDGTKGSDGCVFCRAGGAEFTHGGLGVRQQITRELDRIRKKWPEAQAIAYFQAHTNTYAPLAVLKNLYETALAVPGICGLSIATRCDALPDDVVSYLASLSQTTYLTVELGLQTVHDRTADRIWRGHTYAEFLDAYHRLKAQGIRVCIHLIDGLPGESFVDMVQTAREVGALRPDAVKIHLLHILRDTALADWYMRGEITPMTREDYIRTVCAQLAVLPPETVIERITGDGARDTLIAPLWSLDKIAVLGGIDRFLAENDLWQGKLYNM